MLKFEDVKKLEPGDMIIFDKSIKTWIVQTATFTPGTQKFKVWLGDPDKPANGTYFTEKQLPIANWVKEGSAEPEKQAVVEPQIENSEVIQPAVAEIAVETPVGDKPSIADIYDLCAAAGVNPDDLELAADYSTLAQVKKAIVKAKKKASSKG